MEDEEQTSVALSSVEAEYMGTCQAAKEVAWLTCLLEDFGLYLWSLLVILGDNQDALALTQTPVFHRRSKHIAIQYYFTRELVQAGQRIVKYISTKAIVDDALTSRSPLPRSIVDNSPVRVLGLLQVQGNQQHSSLNPPRQSSHTALTFHRVQRTYWRLPPSSLGVPYHSWRIM